MVIHFENVFSALIMKVFWGKIRELGTLWKKNENMMRKNYFFFEEKTFSSFKIAFLPNWEGAKYAGGSRRSCQPTFQGGAITAVKFLKNWLTVNQVLSKLFWSKKQVNKPSASEMTVGTRSWVCREWIISHWNQLQTSSSEARGKAAIHQIQLQRLG